MSDVDDRVRRAEQEVLGALLSGRDSAFDVFDECDPEDFWQPRHETLAHVLRQMHRDRDPIAPTSVAARLGGELRRVGGLPYLLELHGLGVSAVDPAWIAREIVRPAALLRAVQSAGHRLSSLDLAAALDGDVLDIVNAMRAEIDVAIDRGKTMRASSSEQDVYEAVELLEAAADALPTPWAKLSEAIGGWRPGCFYVIGARPAIGKSVIGSNCIRDAAERGGIAYLASLEMSKVEVYHRMLCDVGNVDQNKLLMRTMDTGDWQALARAAKHIAGLPIVVDDSPRVRVEDIHAHARSLSRQGRLGLVVVDYLQLMAGKRAATVNRQEEVAGFSRALKLLAKELHVPVIGISQLNRSSEHRGDRMPQMSDLRETGALEQDADGVILLHRDDDDEDYPDTLWMFVAKSRHGPSGQKLRLTWQGEFARASDYIPQPAIGSYYDEPETA